MHCLAQWAAAWSADGPGDAGAEVAVGVVPVLAPRRRGVPGHRGALLDGHEHVGQRVLDRLELADGPAELDPHLGVLRRRLEAPACDPGALRRGQDQRQAAHLCVGHEQRSAGTTSAVAVDLEHPEGPGGVEGRECPDRHLVTEGARGRGGTTARRRPAVQRHEHEPRRGQPEDGAHRAGERAAPSRRREADGAERHGRRDGAVGQARQQRRTHRLVRMARDGGRHEQGGEDGAGEEGVAQLLEHHGELGQREPLATRRASGRWSPSHPWAAIFSHTAGRSDAGAGASATARGSAGGQWVWSQRSAVRRSDSCSSVTAIGTTPPLRAAPRRRHATARWRRPGTLAPRCAAAPRRWRAGSRTTAWPSSLRSNVSGAQNTQFPTPCSGPSRS